MKKNLIVALLIIFTVIILATSPSVNAGSGRAGVGVLNVPPQFNQIRLVQQGDFIRVYITCSDYNSWQDIIYVSVILEVSGEDKTEFIYKQYEDKDSYDRINEFVEIPDESSLLVKKRCSYDYTINGETVEERCYLYILMVFYSTLFTRLKILIEDRGGSTASSEIDYSSEELARSGDFIVFPGPDGPMSIEVSPYLLDSIALKVGRCSANLLNCSVTVAISSLSFLFSLLRLSTSSSVNFLTVSFSLIPSLSIYLCGCLLDIDHP